MQPQDPRQSSQPSIATTPSPVPAQYPAQPHSGMSTRKKVLIVVVVLLGFNMLSGAALFLYGKLHTHKAPKTNDALVTTLQQKPALTAADLQSVNKEDAFYAYVKKAAQEKKAIITKAYYFSEDGTPKNENSFSRVGVDYATKKIVYAEESAFEDSRDRIRCHDGVQDDYSAISKTWERSAQATNCAKDKLYSETTDGFNAGGLSAEHAETFVSYVRSHTGLLDVKNLQLADHQGKQYLHFTVTLNQITVKDTKFAAQWLMFAFKKTGLNPDDYPYGYVGAGGEGFTLEYYVNPATGLPAYSELTALAAPGDTSGNKTGDYHYRVQYDFMASTFDASTANDTDITLTW